MTTPERKREMLRNLTPKQVEMLIAYEKQHTEITADPEKTAEFTNMMMMLEDYFRLCHSLSIPLEPEIHRINKDWKKHLKLKGNAVKELDDMLHKLAALAEQEER